MNIGTLSTGSIDAASGSLQQQFAVSTMKNSLDFQANMVNQLVSDGAQTSNELKANAMSSMGIGTNLNITV